MPDASPRLPFEIDDTIDPTLVTGRAGVPLVIELFRQLGVAQTINAEVAVKQRQRGLPPSELVESLIVLWASGGDRCQDLTMLREDQALATLLGHPLPAATTMRDFLEAFHVAAGPLWAAGPAATIPVEPAPPGRARARQSHPDRGPPTGGASADRHPRCGRHPRGEPQGRGDRGLRRDPGLPAGRGPLGRTGRDPARPVPRWARPGGVRQCAGSRTGRGQSAPGDHADRSARRQRLVRDGSPPLVRGEDNRLRHQRGSVGATSCRNRPPPRDRLASRARRGRRDPHLGRGRGPSRAMGITGRIAPASGGTWPSGSRSATGVSSPTGAASTTSRW